MCQHQTASLKNKKRKAEELGGEPFGFAPFRSFIHDFNPAQHHRTRSLFDKCAPLYLSGLIGRHHGRNLEKISEHVDGADYQALHHFISHSPWDDQALCERMSQYASRLLGGTPRSGLIIDPSGLPKKGTHSVGVKRQYCGATGKIDNCQLAVFAALVNENRSVLINKRLHLPEEWCDDEKRCRKAGVPRASQGYKTNQQLAMELIQDADRHGVDYAWVGLDAEFGTLGFLLELAAMNKEFMVDVRVNTRVYLNHPFLDIPQETNKKRRFRMRRKSVPVSSISKRGRWKRVTIRDGAKGPMTAKIRKTPVWIWNGEVETEPVRVYLVTRKLEGEPKGKKYKYSLSNAWGNPSCKELAYKQSQRFWVEQAIKECKDGLGMDEYQTRHWRAWHHQVALTMLAALYLMKLKVENGEGMPLLSIYDLKEIICVCLPLRPPDLETVWRHIENRHRRRASAIMSAARQKPPPD